MAPLSPPPQGQTNYCGSPVTTSEDISDNPHNIGGQSHLQLRTKMRRISKRLGLLETQVMALEEQNRMLEKMVKKGCAGCAGKMVDGDGDADGEGKVHPNTTGPDSLSPPFTKVTILPNTPTTPNSNLNVYPTPDNSPTHGYCSSPPGAPRAVRHRTPSTPSTISEVSTPSIRHSPGARVSSLSLSSHASSALDLSDFSHLTSSTLFGSSAAMPAKTTTPLTIEGAENGERPISGTTDGTAGTKSTWIASSLLQGIEGPAGPVGYNSARVAGNTTTKDEDEAEIGTATKVQMQKGNAVTVQEVREFKKKGVWKRVKGAIVKIA